MDKIRAQVRIQLGYTTSAVGISLRFGCYDTPDVSTFPVAIQLLQGIARNKFLAKVRQPLTHNFCTGCSCKVTDSSPRRTKSGTRRLSPSDPLHYIVGLMHSQSILRNAAIPNYLIPLPFQKVIRV